MKLTFRTKLFLPLIISWLCLFAVVLSNVLHTKQVRLDEKRAALSDVSVMAMSVVQEYAKMVSEGVMPEAEAKKQALARVKALRFGNGTDGYFSVLTSQPMMLMHPFKPEMRGKDMSQFKDANGYYLYNDLARIAKSSGKEFIYYVWARPGQTEPLPKLGLVTTFKPWDWSFLPSIYLDDVDELFKKDLWRSGLLLLGIGVALTVLVFLIIRSIERSIGGDPQYAAKIAVDIADGDLTTFVDVKNDDKGSMLLSMKSMQQQLVSTLSTIQESSRSIATASVEIAQGNSDLSSRTESQASAIEETAATMEELTTTVKQNAENARHANQLAVSASGVAVKGGTVVAQVVDTMSSITESSKKIVDIISVIDSIAFQTNILALNAAVEAARAGEQGRGFAVVASEVRNLAQRSASAAKEIKALIGDSVGKVDAGSKLVGEAGATMEEIVASVKKVTDIMAEIMTASQEQSSGIDQVNQAIGQMDQMTQQNAALVEEAAAAATSMQDQAASLARAVSVFRLASGQPALGHPALKQLA
jgi:methyl-accepting chemotaxis protein